MTDERRGLMLAKPRPAAWMSILLAAALLTPCLTPQTTQGQSRGTGERYVLAEEPPEFKENHQLPPLSHWRMLAPVVQKPLAEDWGYALLVRARTSDVDNLDNPDSEAGRIVQLAASDPERYPLTVLLAPANNLRSSADDISYEDFPKEAFYLDENGELVNGEHHMSPLAEDAHLQPMVDHLRGHVERILEYAEPVIFLNGGEWGFEKPQRTDISVALQDPQIRRIAADWEPAGERWMEFASDEKARHERLFSEAMRELAPNAHYILYSEVGGGHPRRYMVDDWTIYDFFYRPGVSTLASSRHYYRHGNSGFTGSRDILSQLLNCRAQEIEGGAEHAYYWLSAGWTSRVERGGASYANQDLYEGWLKTVYTSGSIGGIAGYFGNRPYADPVEESMPQFFALGRTHALFSHIDEFLLNSHLLPGPENHRWSRDLPAYEFPSGHENTRVLVRKHDDRDQWLVSAWAADGRHEQVRIDVPGLGRIEIESWPEGNLRLYTLENGQRREQTVMGIDDDLSTEQLRVVMETEGVLHRREAIQVLRQRGDEARKILAQSSRDRDPLVRINALRGLAEIDTDEARAYLLAAMDDHHAGVRQTARRLLNSPDRIGRR